MKFIVLYKESKVFIAERVDGKCVGRDLSTQRAGLT
jgi:hypothetical protein